MTNDEFKADLEAVHVFLSETHLCQKRSKASKRRFDILDFILSDARDMLHAAKTDAGKRKAIAHYLIRAAQEFAK